jgi:hypothetical protein
VTDFLTAADILFGIAVFTALAGLWWRVEARIDGAKARAAEVAKELAAYQRHVAETYVTKDGLREQIGAVMSGISDLKQSVGHVANRVDSLVDQQRPTARRRGASE